MEHLPDRRILRISVGTTNPCKIKAVEIAFRRILENNNYRLHTTTTNTAEHNKNLTTIGSITSSSGVKIATATTSANVVELDIQGCNVESIVSAQPYNDMETKRGAMNRARNAYCFHHDNKHRIASAMVRPKNDSAPSLLPWLPDLAIGIEGGLEHCDDNDSNNNYTELNATTTGSHQQDKTTIPSTSTTTSPSKQLYCMAWIAIYGRRTEWTNAIFATMTEGTSVVVHNTANDNLEMIDTNPLLTDTNNEIYGFSKAAMFLLPPSSCALIVDEGMELGHADDLLFRRTNSKQASGTVGLLTNSIIDRTMYYEHAIHLAMIPWMHPNLYPNGNTVYCTSRIEVSSSIGNSEQTKNSHRYT